jgi:hypothetical protein
MLEIQENKPFRINFKNKDQTIFMVQNQILKIFFRDDFGWLSVPDEMYNRTWSYIKRKGITYISEDELLDLSKQFTNGSDLLNLNLEGGR